MSYSYIDGTYYAVRAALRVHAEPANRMEFIILESEQTCARLDKARWYWTPQEEECS